VATFTIAVSGTEPISIQWQQDNAGDNNFVDMVGETDRSLTVDDSSVNQYRANVSNACGAQTSDVVRVVEQPSVCKVYECDAFLNAALNSGSQALWLATDGTNYTNEEQIAAVRKIGGLRSVFSTGGGGPDLLSGDACQPENSLNLGGGGGGGSLFGTGHQYGGTGFSGSWASLVSHKAATSNGAYTPIQFVYDSGNSVQTTIQYQTGNNVRLVLDGASTVQEEILVDVIPNLNVPHLLFFEQDWDNATWTLTINGIVTASGTIDNTDLVGGPAGEIQVGNSSSDNNGSQSFMMFWGSGTIPAADKAALIDGWERNKATYVDPNPNCVPP